MEHCAYCGKEIKKDISHLHGDGGDGFRYEWASCLKCLSLSFTGESIKFKEYVKRQGKQTQLV